MLPNVGGALSLGWAMLFMLWHTMLPYASGATSPIGRPWLSTGTYANSFLSRNARK